MAIENDIYSVLSPLVGGRVYPLITPEEPTKPYIVYQVVSNVSQVSLSGPTGLSRRRVQVDVYDLTYAGMKGLEPQVESAMAGAAFQGIPILYHEVYEPLVKLFRNIMEFSVWS